MDSEKAENSGNEKGELSDRLCDSDVQLKRSCRIANYFTLAGFVTFINGAVLSGIDFATHDEKYIKRGLVCFTVSTALSLLMYIAGSAKRTAAYARALYENQVLGQGGFYSHQNNIHDAQGGDELPHQP